MHPSAQKKNPFFMQGTYFATAFKPPCPQPSGSRIVRAAMEEDCLYLNVWTNFLPRSPGDGRPRPVIVFLGRRNPYLDSF